MAACDERPRNPRPSGGSPRIVDARLKELVGIQPDAEGRQPVDHGSEAVDPPAPLFGQEFTKRRESAVDEVAENVHVDFVANSCDLDAWHELDVSGGAGS